MNLDLLLPALFLTFVAWRFISFWRVRRRLPELLGAGAQVVDVRTPGEFAAEHAPGSRNIPLAELEGRCGELDPGNSVVLCCASGTRSGMACRMLRRRGFSRVFNAGSWRQLR